MISVEIMVNAESIINRLTGEWRVSAKFSMEDGSVAKGQGTATARSVALGRGVQVVLKGNLEGIGTYEEYNIVAYDLEEDVINHFVVTSMGVVRSQRSVWRRRQHGAAMERHIRGMPAEEEITVNLTSEDEFTIRQVDRVEGKVTTIGDYLYRRSSRRVLEEPVPEFA